MIEIKSFFHGPTYTLTYVVFDKETRDAIVIDPVYDYDAGSSTITTTSADEVLAYIAGQELTVHGILETHAHADHISAAQHLKAAHPDAKTVIGAPITVVQETFKPLYGLDDLATDGSQFDLLVENGQEVSFGSLKVRVIGTPGHTPACVSYLVEDAVFTGDAIFMPDQGTGRCDFPNGSADDLYTSIHERLYGLDDATRVFVGHDYQPGGRELKYESTIADQKAGNIWLTADTGREDFVERRAKRDAVLNFPKLLFQSIQLNIDGGRFPKDEPKVLRIPLTVPE